MASVDHRKGPRRRGDELNQAIFAATVAELLDSGYPKLTMDRVAARARTSKASLYRRWPSRVELVLDALLHHFPSAEFPLRTGTVRGDLIAILRKQADVYGSPLGEAARAMMMEAHQDPELGRQVRVRAVDQRNELLFGVLRKAAERGEVRAKALTKRIAGIGPALVREHLMLHGPPVPDEVIAEIVDDVLLPLVSARRPVEESSD